ncbi:hypothetical protein [Devosia sediminis]|uniref:Uncharacterized protein n=1 Tax=Devosia sediminis TaxID=2798801 RepID=A0A934J0R0_9HYPH|nr:hypothetical protein [Devosia sediminis]MBJ3785489.1 hypothetical protein [Devosia sediminis]
MALALLCLGPVPAALGQSESGGLPAPSDIAIGDTTYAELIAMALPGALETDEFIVVEKDVAVPHIEGPDFTVVAPAPVTVADFNGVGLSIDGEPHLALMIELAEAPNSAGPIAALAVFDVTGAPELVDVVDIGFDRQSGFALPPTLQVGWGHELILGFNSHGNAGQFYNAITIVDVVEGRLTMVDQILTLDVTSCEETRRQYLDYVVATPEGDGKGDFTVIVRDVLEPSDEACPAGDGPYMTGETSYSVEYRWDESAGRYVAQGEGWAEFDEMNSARF